MLHTSLSNVAVACCLVFLLGAAALAQDTAVPPPLTAGALPNGAVSLIPRTSPSAAVPQADTVEASWSDTPVPDPALAHDARPLGGAARESEEAKAAGTAPAGGLDRAEPRRFGALGLGELLRVGGALAVVIGLLVLLRLLVRRTCGLTLAAGRPSGVLEILARYPVARGQQLVLLKMARRILLVHQSGSAMTTLSELTDPNEVASLLSRVEAGSRKSAARRFQSALQRSQSEHRLAEQVAHDLVVRAPEASGEIVDLTQSRRGGRRLISTARLAVLALVAFAACTANASGQEIDPFGAQSLSPLGVLEDAARATPGMEGGLSGALNIVLLLTVLSLAPAIMLLCTCFTRIVIVLGLLRQALGTQGLPPSQVVVGLSLFITLVVMAPTLERMYVEGIQPYTSGEIKSHAEAWERSKQPLRDFMFAQIEATGNWSGVYMMLNYRGVDTSNPETLTRGDVDMLSLIPAYVLSELKVAFLMGFRIYMPFLVIDMVIASMLISMGMLMLPPVLISLPFKLLLFVLVDGWSLVVESLLNSVAQPDMAVSLASAIAGGGP